MQEMSGNDKVEEISYDRKDYYISYVPIKLKGESDSWSVFTMQEKSSATAVVNRIVVVLIIIVIIFITAAVTVITVLARKLTKPIVSLSKLAGDAAEGNFYIQADESSRNELACFLKALIV